MENYIRRSLESILKHSVREFPALVLTGPRQSGKTTLLKHIFSGTHRYLSLESPDIREAATSDPRGFLDFYSPPVIFDEIHYTPDLLFYIKEKIDQRRNDTGQFIVTGSQNQLLMERVTESLAERAVILRLLPLSNREITGNPEKNFPWEEGNQCDQAPGADKIENWKSFLRGYYPELLTNPTRDEYLWHGSYVQTYLERDLRSLRQVGDLTSFQNFLRLLASRSAQLLHLSGIARDLGISLNTVKAWISILEATYQIVVIHPYFANMGKRLVKTPKIYFTDVGTLCYLTGLRDPEHAAASPMGGAIFETAVFSEIFKTILHRGEIPQLYFWRTSTGTEVDFLIENQGQLIPIEVKQSATPRLTMTSRIQSLRKDLGDRIGKGYVIHPGSIQLPLGKDTLALPFSAL